MSNKVIKCICFGDQHFQTSNVTESYEFIQKAVELIKLKKPDFIVALGDILHTFERIHITPLKVATKFLKELSDLAPTFQILGNHDSQNNQQFLTNNHAFNSFKKWENLTVCDRPKKIEIGNCNFIFCPYVPPGRFLEALNTQFSNEEIKKATCIFGHQEIKGCYFNPVAQSTIGDDWPTDFPLLVSGHIHSTQWVNENVYYPGSAMQTSFGETENKIVAWIKFSDDGERNIKEIDLGLKKKKIVYTDFDKLESTIEKIENDGNSTKLAIKGSPEEFKTFRKSEKYSKLVKAGIKVSFTAETITTNNSEMNKPNSNNTKKSVIDILKDLIEDESASVKDSFERLTSLK